MLKAEEQFKKMVQRLMALPQSQQDALIAGAAPTSHDATSDTPGGYSTSRSATSSPPTGTTTTLTTVAGEGVIASPPGKTVGTARRDISSVPALLPIALPAPYGIMTLKHLAHSLPEVVPADLKPFWAFHSGSFTKEAVAKKNHNLLA